VLTVKSVYVHLQNRFGSEQLDPILEKALKKHWCTNDASKVSIFVWRLLIDKLPTREALFRKGIITNNLDTCCVFCLNLVEDVHHVFFNCSVTATVWENIFK
jgi:hypothetical protein